MVGHERCDLWCHNNINERLVLMEEREFTKHFISADIDARYAESGIRICAVFINREFPVMNSARKADRAESDAMFPAVGRHSSVVTHEV